MLINTSADRQNGLIDYLKTHHRGKNKAVTSSRLEAAFDIKGAEVRRIVNEARSGGYPICSDNSGYYYAANKRELNATIEQLSGRVENISNARDGLLTALGKSQ